MPEVMGHGVATCAAPGPPGASVSPAATQFRPGWSCSCTLVAPSRGGAGHSTKLHWPRNGGAKRVELWELAEQLPPNQRNLIRIRVGVPDLRRSLTVLVDAASQCAVHPSAEIDVIQMFVEAGAAGMQPLWGGCSSSPLCGSYRPRFKT